MLVVALPDSGNLALWGVVISTAAGLIKGVLDKRAERAERLLEHRIQMEDREASRALTRQESAAIQSSIARNTELTVATGIKADKAYDVANHVNDKIATLAQTALVEDRANARKSTEMLQRAIEEQSAIAREASAKIDAAAAMIEQLNSK
jgi:hypothetical protein